MLFTLGNTEIAWCVFTYRECTNGTASERTNERTRANKRMNEKGNDEEEEE